MKSIRRAVAGDLCRIAEIEIFNYRLNFYPIFRSDAFYFGELQVSSLMEAYMPMLGEFWVYDDGVIKGFMQVRDDDIKKLFVEPVLQGRGIGSALLESVIRETGAGFLWALEKNHRAIAFYQCHGFVLTQEKRLEEDTDEYLVRMRREP